VRVLRLITRLNIGGPSIQAIALADRLTPRGFTTRLVYGSLGEGEGDMRYLLPASVVLEGYFSKPKTALFVGIERMLAHATDRIVAVSPAIRDELLHEHRIGRADQYRVVPLGFDLSALTAIDDTARAAARAGLGIPAAAHVVSTVGRLTAIKQHELFLETARLVCAADPLAQFLIAGDGELRAPLEELARDFGIVDRVRFLGWRRDLAAIYGASDVFLLTSRNEGTPVALIESLASAVPGVSTDVGGVRDVLAGGGGISVSSGNAQDLATAVAEFLANPMLSRTTGERGRASVSSRYGIDRLVDDIDALYRDLLR
jgi:glycosyltransferase involved in cell wall biosynthesis